MANAPASRTIIVAAGSWPRRFASAAPPRETIIPKMALTNSNADIRPTRQRRRRRSRVAVWLVLLCVGAACTAVVYGVLRDRANAGAGLPAYSMYSDAPD